MTTLREMSSRWYSETVAQEIRKDIDQWLGSQKIDLACKKWPWELLQNAFDAAIALKQSDLNVKFLTTTDGKFVFSHDGGIGVFTEKEFFRLLTRGTTKDSFDKEQEGRFGEGFVVTHVLSEVVDVTGTISDERGSLPFKITIDRRGTWEEISSRIGKCIDKIDSLHSYEQTSGWASFEYSCFLSQTSKSAIQLGFLSLQELLPYVIAIMFVRNNIRVRVQVGSPQNMSTFSVDSNKSEKIDGRAWKVVIQKECPAEIKSLTVLMFPTAVHGHYLALPISEDIKRVLLPRLGEENRVPRLFSNLPLLGTIDLPLPCVLFGILNPQDWQVDKNRLDLNYQNEVATSKLKQDIMEITDLWKWLNEKTILDRHRLFGFKRIDNRPGAEKWIQILQELARELALLGAVECSDGTSRKATEVIFPSVSDDVVAKERKVLVMDTWKLENFTGNHVPCEAIALDWSEIAQGWGSIDAKLTMHTLEDILKSVSNHSNLDNLLTDKTWFPQIDTREKCLEFLKLVTLVVLNYVTTVRNTPAFVADAKIYCDQRGNLKKKNPNLVLDLGVSESLKNAAELLGYPIREKLLAKEQTIPDADRWFRENLQLQTWTDLEATKNIFEYLRNFRAHLSEIKKDKEKLTDYKNGLGKFTYFLVQSVDKPQILEAVGDLREYPFIWADNEIETMNQKQIDRCYLPSHLLDTTFQQHFINLFPSSIRLSDIYVPDIHATKLGIEVLGQFLVERRIAVANPFYEKRRDLDKDETKALSAVESAEQHSLQEVSLKAVAGFNHLLSSVGRGGSSPTPELLLDFALRFLAAKDESWKNAMPVTAKCTQPGHKECTLQIYPSEWLLMLKRVFWVPTNGGFATPNGDNLEPFAMRIATIQGSATILKSELARELLSKLGCDSLNLTILSLGGSDEALRPTIRSRIATIASFAQSVEDLSKIEELVREHTEKSRLVKRNQVLGELVQRAVAQAFRDQGLKVRDDEIRNLKSHDFKVITGRELTEEDILLLVRDIWVEVKETNQNEVRMTKPQAEAAVQRKSMYALCVLDLRGQEELRTSIIAGAESIDMGTSDFNKFVEQMTPRISPFIRITQIGDYIEPKMRDYKTATLDEGSGVRIESGPQLRFIVSSSIWANKAKALPQWVQGFPLTFGIEAASV